MTNPCPVGEPLPGWTPPPAPGWAALEGDYARLERLDADKHAALLFRAYEGHDWIWDYLPYGPFHSAAQYHRWARDSAEALDPYFFAVYDKEARRYGGVGSYLRITPQGGAIELGHLCLAPCLQHTRAATEMFFLTMQWAFQAGYRRFEWKCDALNRPSRRAAQRLGLSYEGIFRQATVVKGRNRDTAWFAAIDKDWPALQEAFRVWLSPANFTSEGAQKERLSDLTKLAGVAPDPGA